MSVGMKEIYKRLVELEKKVEELEKVKPQNKVNPTPDPVSERGKFGLWK